jgi:hypothetical protein
MVDGETSKAGKGLCSFLLVAGFDVVARCFRKDQHATHEDDGPGELERDL